MVIEKVLLLLLVTALCAGVHIHAAHASPRCSGHPNTIPVHSAAPIFVRSVPNGKRFLGGGGNDTFHIVHVYGTPYQQGFAQGKLFSTEIKALMEQMPPFIEWFLEKEEPNIPKSILELITKFGVPFVLQLSYDMVRSFSPQRYIDEMQGIADGAGIPVQEIQNFNMLPEMLKALGCTIVGANGEATTNGSIYHLRGLDYWLGVKSPTRDYAAITVYHDENLQVANVGWLSMVGSLTAMSSGVIGVGMKVWSNHPKGIDGTFGEPWMFLMRDILAEKTLSSAIAKLENANKTCAIYAGVGGSATNEFRGVMMAQKYFDVFNDSSINTTHHPIIKNVMYWDQYEQPSHSYCLADLLQQFYGMIDAGVLALQISPIARTGDFHSVAFDYQRLLAYVANARKTFVHEGDLSAYDRQYTLVDVGSLFREPPP